MNANPQELSTRVSCHFNANSVSVRQQPGKWGKEFIMRKYRQVIGDINKMILDYVEIRRLRGGFQSYSDLASELAVSRDVA